MRNSGQEIEEFEEVESLWDWLLVNWSFSVPFYTWGIYISFSDFTIPSLHWFPVWYRRSQPPNHLIFALIFHSTNFACSVAQWCMNFCNPMDSSTPGSPVCGIFQARILKWGAISYSKGSSQPRNRTRVSWVSCTGRRILYPWATCIATQLSIRSSFQHLMVRMSWNNSFPKDI